MNNNLSYNFRIGKRINTVKKQMVEVIMKTGEIITILASFLSNYINLYKSKIFTYKFI